MTKLPTLQRRIARYLSVKYSDDLTSDELSMGIVGVVIDYLTEQSVKRTEISVEDFVCANIKGEIIEIDEDGNVSKKIKGPIREQ